ncbi:MAG: Virginiamycin B lyase [Phycisphaerae bacterium]|nr:Virginiamycin B lyase [Phycisphaerae bacterium]
MNRVRRAALALVCLTGCGSGAELTLPRALFGRTGMGPGEFNYPRAAAGVPGECLFVVDKAGRVQRLGEDGQPERLWRMPQTSAGKPTGLGVERAARKLYAADTHYSRVSVFDFDGTPLETFGSYGDGPGQFRLPTDVALDAKGNIYVAEYGGNDRISVFDAAHDYQMSFDGSDSGLRLERPQSLAFAGDGTLWVADACNHRVCHFDAQGRFLSSFGVLGEAAGALRYPYGCELLSDQTLVVCEYGNNRVQRFTAEGRSLGIWGRAGRRPGELAYPWAIYVGSDDATYIVDSGNNRVQVIDGCSDRTWR